jgi:hypothetical protein
MNIVQCTMYTYFRVWGGGGGVRYRLQAAQCSIDLCGAGGGGAGLDQLIVKQLTTSY